MTRIGAAGIAVSVVCLAGCIAMGPPPPDYTGNWDVSGTWDLSGPFGGGRTVGESVSEMVVGRVVSLSPVPSLLQSEAEELLLAAIGGPVAAVVDANVPPELAPNSALVQALGTTLASIDVTGDVTIEPGGLLDDFGGTERIATVSYTYNNTTTTLDAAALHGVTGISIAADWSGDNASQTSIEVAPHAFEIQYGELVERIALEVTDLTGMNTIRDDMIAATDCAAIVAAALGGSSSIVIGVSEFTLTLDATDLDSACQSLRAELSSRVFGLMAIGTPVTIGGPVGVHDDDGDEIADRLESLPAYGGTVDLVPSAIAPRIGVDFSAVRAP